jgi:hypothetical protein
MRIAWEAARGTSMQNARYNVSGVPIKPLSLNLRTRLSTQGRNQILLHGFAGGWVAISINEITEITVRKTFLDGYYRSASRLFPEIAYLNEPTTALLQRTLASNQFI